MCLHAEIPCIEPTLVEGAFCPRVVGTTTVILLLSSASDLNLLFAMSNLVDQVEVIDRDPGRDLCPFAGRAPSF